MSTYDEVDPRRILDPDFVDRIVRDEMDFVMNNAEDRAVTEAALVIFKYYSVPE